MNEILVHRLAPVALSLDLGAAVQEAALREIAALGEGDGRDHAARALLCAAALTAGCRQTPADMNGTGGTAPPPGYRITTLVSGLDTPWDLAWGPDGNLWFTERGGRISRFDFTTGRLFRLAQLDVLETGESGLMGMAFHPDFAAHVARTLQVARYRIWRTPEGMALDDGWGARGHFRVVYAAEGTRVMLARGHFDKALLPPIRGQAVAMIEYRLEPAGGGRSLVRPIVSGYVKLDSRFLAGLLWVASAAAQRSIATLGLPNLALGEVMVEIQ